MRQHALLLLLVIGHLLLAAVYSMGNPLGEAPDEADHWAFIVYLARERRLPQGPHVTQSKHPPLYHATSAAIASLSEPSFDFLRANPDVQIAPGPHWSPNFFVHTTREDWPWRNGPMAFHLVRLWSVLLSTLTVLASYGLFRAATPSSQGLILSATAVIAFLPEFAFIGGAINNDNAAALFGALSLWGALTIYTHGRLRAGWWTPLALGLGLLSKVSTTAIWPAVALALLLPPDVYNNIYRGISRPLWVRIRNTAVTFLSALLIAAPWLWRNWQLYGDPLGMDLVRQTIDLRSSPWTASDTVWLVQGWCISFWGKFGGAGHIPYPSWIYTLATGIVLLSMLGLIRLLIVHTRPISLPILLILAAAAGGMVMAIWRYSLMALGTDQARLLYPALAPLAFLLVLGLHTWLPVQTRRAASIGGISLLLIFAVYGLTGVIRPAFAPPPPPPASELQALPVRQVINYDQVQLLNWQLNGQPTLYWAALAPLDEDYRTIVRITSADGALVWEWKRSPGYGRYSTDHWATGAIIRDDYTIQWPDWAGPGQYRVEVALQPYAGDLVLPTIGDQTAADPNHPFLLLGTLER